MDSPHRSTYRPCLPTIALAPLSDSKAASRSPTLFPVAPRALASSAAPRSGARDATFNSLPAETFNRITSNENRPSSGVLFIRPMVMRFVLAPPTGSIERHLTAAAAAAAAARALCGAAARQRRCLCGLSGGDGGGGSLLCSEARLGRRWRERTRGDRRENVYSCLHHLHYEPYGLPIAQ